MINRQVSFIREEDQLLGRAEAVSMGREGSTRAPGRMRRPVENSEPIMGGLMAMHKALTKEEQGTSQALIPGLESKHRVATIERRKEKQLEANLTRTKIQMLRGRDLASMASLGRSGMCQVSLLGEAS